MRSVYKLMKARTDETTSSASPLSPYFRVDDAEQPIRTSFENLNCLEARQVLRQQLTSTFPEAGLQGSSKAGIGKNMALKDRIVRRGSSTEIGGNVTAKNSSSTINSVDVKRLSVMPEQTNKAIDIEHAINLLQELKKTASPEDLVALHRALLPTKNVETVTSPIAASFDEPATFSNPTPYRRGSVIPPGLATRGGFSEDLLRRQGELPSFTARRTLSSSVRNLAALDLADETSNVSSHRSATPSENIYPHMGAYRPGTLRITNGAASPEPSIQTELNSEKVEALNASEDDFAVSAIRTNIETAPGRSSMDSNMHRRASGDSLRISGRLLSSEQAKQQRKHPLRRLSIHSTPSKESFGQQTSVTANTSTPPSGRSSERDSSISPASESYVPRCQHRWSHRASQISAEYASDCEVPASPFDEKPVPHQFATRLSTVYDSDTDEANDIGGGTPEAALAMLNGNMNSNNMDRSTSAHRPQHYNDGILLGSESQHLLRPLPQTIDSGYSSDISFQNAQMEQVGARPSFRTYIANDDGLVEVQHLERMDPVADDAQSLYTFQEVLSRPDLLSLLPEPDRTQVPEIGRPKKSSSLLKLYSQKADRRTSLPPGLSSVAGVSSNTSGTTLSTQSPTAGGNKVDPAGKHPKRLQKPMPKALKEQLREERRKQEMAQGAELPTIPQALSTTHARRISGLGSTVKPEQIGASISSSTPHEDFEEKQSFRLDEDAGENYSFDHGNVKMPSFFKRRSKSLARERDCSILPDTEAENSAQVKHPSSMTNLRSRSHTRGRGKLEKSTSSAFVTDSDNEAVESSGEDFVPAYTDIGSVARALGSSSYDISTNLSRRSAGPVPGAVQHQIQSPYMISTGLTKTKVMKGMTPEMASEFARMRSRDFAHPDMPHLEYRPRMPAPASSTSRCAAIQNGSLQPSVTKDDPAIRQQLNTGVSNIIQTPEMFKRSSIYAESIPPLPELPADVEAKASKADEMMAKKLKDSARSSPAGSSRNSREVEPWSPAISAKRLAKKQREAVDQVELKALALLHPVERASAKQNKHADYVSVAIRELSRSNSEESASSVCGEAARWEEPELPSRHSSQHAGWPGWEHQARVWRQHRESLGGNVREPVEDERDEAESPPDMRQAAKSPSIVVSRYITPICADNAAKANIELHPTDRAAQHADEYRALIGDVKESRSDEHGVPCITSATSATSTATLVTVKSWDPRRKNHNISGNNRTLSSPSYQTTVTTRTTAILGRDKGASTTHARTVHGRFIPYSPSQAEVAEQSRAENLAGLVSSDKASIASLTWMNGSANSSVTSLGTPYSSQHKSTETLHDRYSGGLDYGWERGAGFTSSAGTRSNGNEAKRKSVQMGESYGLDLSDVPVFLQRAR